MENKEYLNEKDYQEKTKKLRKIGLGLIVAGAPMFALFLVNFVAMGALPVELSAVSGILGVFGFPILFFGLYFRYILPNQRKFSSYMIQQQMPVAKETAEKIAPTAGVVAKEITKGVKDGLKESKPDKNNRR